ncbi:MAG: sodium-dependent transporter [Lachnospiraceae bacterium]|nr:sodium-dependent transporter [Lachnospiraceae bacterium]
MEREKLGSRLGFILLSAGCAIGIGNVWRFPYVVGDNGGGIFVLFYLIFLVIMGVPILCMEFSVGRGSRCSAATAFRTLEKPGQKWHWHGYAAILGNYVLMFYYTTVAGWMLYYFCASLTGKFAGLDAEGVSGQFNSLMAEPLTMVFCTLTVVIIGFLVCGLGLQNGVERITKGMMLALIVIMIILAVNSILQPGAIEGLKFYLVPDLERVREKGLWSVIVEAMNQSFFTLSLGIGSMAIFGSYIDKDKSLLGESLTIAALDTFVAIVAGLIIFPACFAYGVSPDSGPSLIFITLPNVFNSMPGGGIWGALFFLFMTFAAFSTVLAVFQNIVAMSSELWHWEKKQAIWRNILIVGVCSLPCVLGFNLWSGFQPLGAGSSILDLEDFLVSTILLPGGSFVFLMFCISRRGWGWENFVAEVDQGQGLRFPTRIRGYLTWILPVLMAFLFFNGLYSTFAGLQW